MSDAAVLPMSCQRIPGGRAMLLLLAVAGACASRSELPVTAGFGPQPALPPPESGLVPTVEIVTAVGWPPNAQPVPAAGAVVTRFADGLDHPRWLYVLPNGDVLVAETSGPPRPEDNPGLRGWVMGLMMKKAGSAVPSANRITLLRDGDGDGVAESRTAFLEGLNSPFGMALIGDALYIANTDALVRVPYAAGDTRATEPPTTVVQLPAGARNHHWTKNVIASRDGRKLFVSIGSNSNVAENGLEEEIDRACIWEVSPAGGTHRVYAAGLRNPVGMTWEPTRGALWVAVNERDELGDDLVPDYMTSVRDGGFYGWPFSYFGTHVDARVTPPRPDLVAAAIVPDYALGAHTASLGLVYADATALPPPFQRGMFVGQHGSWNRRPRSGYKVIFVPFRDGMPSGGPIDVLGGFVTADGEAYGRPVGVALDRRGALLVADDVGNAVWRVTSAPQA